MSRAVSPSLRASASLATPAAAPDDLSGALQRARALLGHANALARQLELAELGDISLPPVTASAEDQARLRSVATLYFAAEVESTRLVACVELLARLFVSGGLPIDPGETGQAMVAFYRTRDQRLTTEEREALFGRLFGKSYGPSLADAGARNAGFEPAMIELAAALSDLDANRGDYGPRSADVARLRVAASTLADSLLQGGGGIALFAANELLANIRDALAIMKDPALQGALGGRSVWSTVRNVAARYLQQDVDVTSHATRAKSGMVILAWLADSLPSLGSIGGTMDPGAEVVTSAVQWMQATLALHERGRAAGRAA